LADVRFRAQYGLKQDLTAKSGPSIPDFRAARRFDGTMFGAFAGATSLRPGIKVLADLGYDADSISAFPANKGARLGQHPADVQLK
jgi:hypothetical protein